MSYAKDLLEYGHACAHAGVPSDVADAIRKDAQRLHTFYIQYCNGEIETDENGRASRCYSRDDGSRVCHRTPNPEPGARKRIAAHCAEFGAALEINKDPRGWPVRFTVENITLCPPCRYA